MNKKRGVIAAAVLAATAALWGIACLTGETHVDYALPYSGLSVVPPIIEGTESTCPSDFRTEQVDLTTWLVAADAFFLGTVLEVLPVQDYGVVVSPYGSEGAPEVLPGEECQSVEGAFAITVQPIYRRGPHYPEAGPFQIGMEIGDRQIRFGAEACRRFGANCPQSEGDEVVWPQDATGKIVPGMIVGGALYYVEEYDFFHFLTSESQPFLYVDNSGVVQFQEVRSHCSRYMPPLDEVGGRYWALTFMEEVRQIEHRIALNDRLENPMRVHWKLDDPLGEEAHVHFAGFGECLPKEGDHPGDAPH